MIWDDPWIAAVTDRRGGGPWNSTLPPPPAPLEPDLSFCCLRIADLDISAWKELTGTQWSWAALQERLADAWIACLFQSRCLVGTCVLRPYEDVWVLETLRANKGCGTPLMRSAMAWLWSQNRGPFRLVFTWELSLPQLVWAWWRGRLTACQQIQRGWMWRGEGAPCGFCPDARKAPRQPASTMPTFFRSSTGWAVVDDSGRGDGWGYVIVWRGYPPWAAIAAKKRWDFLWMRATEAPGPDWTWTGEFVVVGGLNLREPRTEWITAEI